MIDKAVGLSMSAEHYTPIDYIEAARATMGAIDLDPASCVAAQERVQATTFYTIEDDGLAQPWAGCVMVNPPGDKTGKLVQAFWRRLADHVEAGKVHQFIWVGFNLSHLRTLQAPASWLLEQCSMFVPRSRMRFSGGSPTRDNAILYWAHRNHDNESGFVRSFSPIGGAFWRGRR